MTRPHPTRPSAHPSSRLLRCALRALAATGAALALAAPAAGQTPKMQPGPEAPEAKNPLPNTVQVTAVGFVPKSLQVKAGDPVLWRNVSEEVHTVTADPALAADPQQVALPEGAEAFHSGLLAPNETYRHRFIVPGRYRYFSKNEEGLVGELVVVGETDPQEAAEAAADVQPDLEVEVEPEGRTSGQPVPGPSTAGSPRVR